ARIIQYLFAPNFWHDVPATAIRETAMPAKERAMPRPKTKTQPAGKAAKGRRPKRAAGVAASTTQNSTLSPTGAALSGGYEIRIRYRGDRGLEELAVPVDDRGFYPSVERWRYVVANRRRITRATRDELSKDLRLWIQDAAHISEEETLSRIRKMAA